MTRISHLPGDLVGEILSRVPLTSLRSVRSTCKTWNTLSKNHIVGKAAARKQLLGFMQFDIKLFSLSFDLQGIRNGSDPCMKLLSVFGQVDQVFHCDGLMLIFTKDKRLVVWNPYTGKTRWIIPPGEDLLFGDIYALGYTTSHTHKILMFLENFENIKSAIYEFTSNSWRVLDVTPDWDIAYYALSLKGNAYFVAPEMIMKKKNHGYFLVCFDFTTERFGPPLALPCHSSYPMPFSCVRDEQLAVLCQHVKAVEMMEIWITTNIEPNTVSWSKFLKVAITQLNGFPHGFLAGSFFIDEEKKAAGVFEAEGLVLPTLYIIGQDGNCETINITSLDFGELAPQPEYTYWEFEFSSYVPSLVRL